MSSGKTYDLEALLTFAGSSLHVPSVECAAERVVHADAKTALVTSDCTESVGQYAGKYHFLSFLVRSREGWKVAAVESTLHAAFSPRSSNVAPLGDFAGSYRTPRGLALQVVAHDGFLTLREPSGLEIRFEPIGPDLFEANYVAPGGWITRFSFARDAAGRVFALSVLSPGTVNTFPIIR